MLLTPLLPSFHTHISARFSSCIQSPLLTFQILMTFRIHSSDGGSPSPIASDHIMECTRALTCTSCALVLVDVLSANAALFTLRRCHYCLGNPLMTPPHSPEAPTFSQTSRVNEHHSFSKPLSSAFSNPIPV